MVKDYGLKNMPKSKLKAEKFLQEITERFDCELRIFIAKRGGIAEVWLSKLNIDAYSNFVKNNQEYTYFILDVRCSIVDMVYSMLEKLMTDFLVNLKEYYYLKSLKKVKQESL